MTIGSDPDDLTDVWQALREAAYSPRCDLGSAYLIVETAKKLREPKERHTFYEDLATRNDIHPGLRVLALRELLQYHWDTTIPEWSTL